MGAGSGMLAAAGLALSVGAGAAHADPPLLNGNFLGGDAENLWTIASTCAPAGCTGTVSSNQGWSSPMTLQDGRWYFLVTKPDGFICSDGSFAPVVVHMSVDPVTLRGVLSADSNGTCPGGVTSATPFQLKPV
ncbi:hypothetical protein V4U86_25275 [Mycobacterium sp. AMU20-3851]|uniref:hypothetical protein n=1 Tax=Mycobacterium sp. AMU20-3851 TaxID=3122055 RepID=UPI0037542098